MAFKTRTINNISDFVRNLTKDKGEHDGVLWYRGQSEDSWPLLPGYMRLKSPPPDGNMLNEFKQSAALLAEFTPQGTFDWLMLMQHYGVPTRLLDWSENPMIALYFGLQSRLEHRDKDAAFWILKPTALNKNANIVDQNDTRFIPSLNDDEPEPYAIEYMKTAPKTELLPIAVIATRNNARIQAQSGVFTIHHFKDTPIEGVGDGSHVIKYRIPSKSKELLADQLETLGLNSFHAFPELTTIGKIIKDRYK